MRTIHRFLHERPTGEAPAPRPAASGESVLARLLSKPSTAKLVEHFVSSLGQRVGAIEEAMTKGDYAQLKTLAHQLKGAAGGYGFPGLTEAARNVEAAAVALPPDPTKIAAQVRALADLCAQTKLAA